MQRVELESIQGQHIDQSKYAALVPVLVVTE